MSKPTSKEDLIALTRELIIHFGANSNTRVEAHYNALDNSIIIGVINTCEISMIEMMTPKLVVDKIDNHFGNPIKDSQFVKNLTQELTDKVKNLEAQNEALRSEVKELHPYKTHYDLQYKMEHGK